MKKGKPAKNVDEYLAAVPEPAQSSLKHIRAVIRSVVPKRNYRSHQLRHPDVQV